MAKNRQISSFLSPVKFITIAKNRTVYKMNPPLLLFIEPIDFHNTLQFYTRNTIIFHPITLQQNTKPKTILDKDNTLGQNTSTIKGQNIPTQHNTTNTKQRKHTYLTKHYTTPEKYK